MKLGQWLVVLALALALAVLGYLLRMTQSQHSDGETLAQVSALALLDAGLGEAVRDVRYSLEVPPPSFAGRIQNLAAAGQALIESPEAVEALPQEVTDAQRVLHQTLETKLALASEFQKQQVSSIEQLQTLLNLGTRLREVTARTPLPALVTALLDDVRAYSQQAAPDSGPRIISLLAQVQSTGRARLKDPAQLALVRELRDAAVAALSARDQTQAVADRLLALPSAAALESFRLAYADFHRAEQVSTARYRLILAVYTLALLVAFGLIGLRLRHSLSALDRANHELQNSNIRLEQQVHERTADLRRALEEVRQQQAQLIQSEKMASLGQMVAGVAHEINMPLGYANSSVAAVRESLPALSKRPDPEALEEYGSLLSDVENGLAQIADLVKSLKSFSRSDRSRTELFNVNDGLDMALKICHSQLKDRVEVFRDYDEVPQIPCAPSQLNQVFLNLINNAGQAIQGQGQIRIRTRDKGDSVEVAIRDTGCGMDPATQAHIFEPFFTTKPSGRGTGLGLSIVYRIIEDHRGRIAVKSAPGAGSEFTLSLPKRSMPAVA